MTIPNCILFIRKLHYFLNPYNIQFCYIYEPHIRNFLFCALACESDDEQNYKIISFKPTFKDDFFGCVSNTFTGLFLSINKRNEPVSFDDKINNSDINVDFIV